MIEVDRVTKKYGTTVALNNVSFRVNHGEIAVLLGPNGAGKSTAIKCISGLLQFEGEVLIARCPCKSIEAKRMLGYIPEMPALYDLLTIDEHMTFISKAYHQELDQEKLNSLYRRFDLEDKKDKLGKELSKGMQQKTSIICALMSHPKVLLFDEPMIGLDPHAIKELKVLLKELRDQGCAIIVSTHVIDSVAELWDKVLIMKQGEIIAVKQREELAESGENLENYFFEVTEGWDPLAKRGYDERDLEGQPSSSPEEAHHE